MPDDLTQSEAKLRKLAERLRQGVAKLFAVTEKQRAAVRQVVREEWEKEQARPRPGAEEQSRDAGSSSGVPEPKRAPQKDQAARKESPEKDRDR
jgi:hypothetical protein